VRLGDNVPPWVRERRQPTKAELADKHVADGGGMGTASGNSLPDDVDDSDTETVELSSGILLQRPKASPASNIKMRKFE
jgi:hypothetical protein